MEHIVQFAINIDDKTIQKRLEDNAYNDIVERIYKDALDNIELPHKYVINGIKRRIDWNRVVYDRLDKFLGDHKDEIIDAAAEKLTRSIRCSKAFKERKQEVMEDTE
ncbi:hypothetical protein [Bifidobacterium moukalabense]|uniref:hypothetical protein n=1 Tax=Bifidobacterium moukalabense TaxID=1333651 RepID=UPI0010F5512D|nr:hypothetical protein [Bifidobacterium moukalabense]